MARPPTFNFPVPGLNRVLTDIYRRLQSLGIRSSLSSGGVSTPVRVTGSVNCCICSVEPAVIPVGQTKVVVDVSAKYAALPTSCRKTLFSSWLPLVTPASSKGTADWFWVDNVKDTGTVQSFEIRVDTAPASAPLSFMWKACPCESGTVNVFFLAEETVPSSNWGIWAFDPDTAPSKATQISTRHTSSGSIEYPGALHFWNGRLYFLALDGTYKIFSVLPDGSDETEEFDTSSTNGTTTPDMDIRNDNGQIEIVLHHAGGTHKRGSLPISSLTTMTTLGGGSPGLAWIARNAYYVYGNANLIQRRDRSGGSATNASQKCTGVAYDSVRDKIYFRVKDVSGGGSGAVKQCDPDLTNIITIISGGTDWSTDGTECLDYDPVHDWIYYCISDGSGNADIYRIHPDGTGNEKVLTGATQGLGDIKHLCVGGGFQSAAENSEKKDLISWWTCEDANMVDSHGTYDLTESGSPTHPAGANGNCINFSTTLNERAAHASNVDLQTGNVDWSLMGQLHVNTLPGSGFRMLAHKDGNFANREWALYLQQSTSQIIFEVFDGGTTSRGTVAISWTGLDTGFHSVYIQHDKATGKIGMSIDNAAISETTLSGAPGTGTAEFALGDRSSGGLGADCQWDEVRFQKRLMTAAERTNYHDNIPTYSDL